MRIRSVLFCSCLAVILVAAPSVSATTITARHLLSKLPVRVERNAGYDRSEFTHWIDADGDGCDTRAEVLISESKVRVTKNSNCTVISGRWLSVFDGRIWRRASDVDIDHLVALGEAWGSGAKGCIRRGGPSRRGRRNPSRRHAECMIGIAAEGAVTVVRLGAWCDFVTEDEYRQRLMGEGWAADEIENLVEDFKQGVSFVVHEFAELSDGGRLTLHEERGFTAFTVASSNTGRPPPSDQWHFLTLENLERDVRTTVLPDEDDTRDEHPWEWLVGLLHGHGVDATAEELRLLPYDVVFSERLRARLGVT